VSAPTEPAAGRGEAGVPADVQLALRIVNRALGTDNEALGAFCDVADYVARLAARADDAARLGDGAALIAAECVRQVSAEGWTAEHDDAHADGSLALAGAVYAWPGQRPLFVKKAWPWDRLWFKPTMPEVEPARCSCRSVGECNHWGRPTKASLRDARVRDLVKAGALIAAEIDRLQRAARRAAAPAPEVDRG
jgi:hypothetical protein